jgi:hypothetical protein
MSCRQRNLNLRQSEKSRPLFVPREQKESRLAMLSRAPLVGRRLRPPVRDAEKDGKRGNVDECFDPLHGQSRRRAKVRSTADESPDVNDELDRVRIFEMTRFSIST